MSQQGAVLQSFTEELVKCIEDMKSRRSILQSYIDKDEEEKVSLEKEMSVLSAKLEDVNNRLAAKKKKLDHLDEVINGIEAPYSKIVDSSQTLLTMARLESAKLDEEDSLANS